MAYYDFRTAGEGEQGAKAYYLGELAHGATMNVAAKYADFANLTAANFIVVPQYNTLQANASNTNYVDMAGWTEGRTDENTATYNPPSISYNPSNGTLSFTSTLVVGGRSWGYNPNVGGAWCFTYPSGSIGLTAKVYLVTQIENL